MIVEIHKSYSGMSGSLRYNQSKVNKDVAEIVAEHGIFSTDPAVIRQVFEDRVKFAVRDVQNASFQMSINPGPDDRIREAQIPAFVKDIMEGLGYGDQPWVIYKHTDIDRVHYHVVSSRINAQGRKIKDFYEQKELRKIVVSLEEKYGYTRGKARTKADDARHGSVESPSPESIPVFDPSASDLTGQVRDCVMHALAYRFVTERQFAEILRCHGVQVQEGLGSDLEPRLYFQGLDAEGRRCTRSIGEAALGVDVRKEMQKRMEAEDTPEVKTAMRSLRRLVKSLSDKGLSLDSFTRSQARMGVDLIIYRDADKVIRGATFIDHKSQCAFKGSELSREMSASLLEMETRNGKDTTVPSVSLGSEEKRAAEKFSASEGLGQVIGGRLGGSSGKEYLDPLERKRKLKGGR